MNENRIGSAAGGAREAGEPSSGTSTCAVCGALFECGMKSGLAACWCTRLPPVAITPGLGCLCPRCLAARAE